MAAKKKTGFNMAGEWRQAGSDMKSAKAAAKKKAAGKKAMDKAKPSAKALATKTSRGLDSRYGGNRVSGASEWADARAQNKAKKSAAKRSAVAPPKRSGSTAR